MPAADRTFRALRREGMADAVLNIIASNKFPYLNTADLLTAAGITMTELKDAAARLKGIKRRPGAPRRVPPQPGEKWCSRCQRYRPCAAFNANRADKGDGLQTYCRDCCKAIYREKRAS